MLFQSTCGKSVSRLTGNPLCCQRQLHHYITPKSINNQELNNRIIAFPKKGEERNDMKQIDKWLQDNNITYRLAKWGNPVYQWWILCIWFTGNIWFLSWPKRIYDCKCHKYGAGWWYRVLSTTDAAKLKNTKNAFLKPPKHSGRRNMPAGHKQQHNNISPLSGSDRRQVYDLQAGFKHLRRLCTRLQTNASR